MDPDPDDIIRVVNEDSQDECAAEILRLKRKRRGFRAAFTEIQNVVDRLVASSRGPDNRVDKSEDKRLAIERHSLQLEQRYQKLQKLNHRVLSLNFVEGDEQAYQDCIDVAMNLYTQRIENIGALKIAMAPNPNQQAPGVGGPGLQLRPVEALKPSLSLSFDSSPTELSTWLSQIKSYFEASRLHTVPVDQQQAFLRSNLASDVWTVIKQRINIDTRIFFNPLDPDEDSCERFIEAAFQVRYPLIMRRYKFFTYERKGNQTYIDFYAKLQELAAAANLENLEMNDYLTFRVIAGLNNP